MVPAHRSRECRGGLKGPQGGGRHRTRARLKPLDPAGGLTGPWLFLPQGLLVRTVKKILTTVQETGVRMGAPVWMG